LKHLRNNIAIKNFGLNIKRLRTSKSLTQKDIAFDAEIEIMQLSRIERGEINTSLSHIVAIAKALSVKPSELLEIDTE
jgi:transcriptional regulator with XRE-family HTH domain